MRPEPFTCPNGAIATREQLGWRESERFHFNRDDRHNRHEGIWLRPGDTIVGAVPKGLGEALPRQEEVAPAGTRFLGGKVYVVPEKTATGRPAKIIVKYDRVTLPGQEELPVCFIVEKEADELKDGAARMSNNAVGTVVDYWP